MGLYFFVLRQLILQLTQEMFYTDVKKLKYYKLTRIRSLSLFASSKTRTP